MKSFVLDLNEKLRDLDRQIAKSRRIEFATSLAKITTGLVGISTLWLYVGGSYSGLVSMKNMICNTFTRNAMHCDYFVRNICGFVAGFESQKALHSLKGRSSFRLRYMFQFILIFTLLSTGNRMNGVNTAVSSSAHVASLVGVAASALHSTRQNIMNAEENPTLANGRDLPPPADVLGRVYTRLEVIDLSIKFNKADVVNAIGKCKTVSPSARKLRDFFPGAKENYAQMKDGKEIIYALLYNLYYDGDEFHAKVEAILKSKHGECQGLTLDQIYEMYSEGRKVMAERAAPILDDGKVIEPPADILDYKYTKLEVIELAIRFGKAEVINAIDRCESIPQSKTKLYTYFPKHNDKYGERTIRALLRDVDEDSDQWDDKIEAISKSSHGPELDEIYAMFGIEPQESKRTNLVDGSSEEELVITNSLQAMNIGKQDGQNVVPPGRVISPTDSAIAPSFGFGQILHHHQSMLHQYQSLTPIDQTTQELLSSPSNQQPAVPITPVNELTVNASLAHFAQIGNNQRARGPTEGAAQVTPTIVCPGATQSFQVTEKNKSDHLMEKIIQCESLPLTGKGS